MPTKFTKGSQEAKDYMASIRMKKASTMSTTKTEPTKAPKEAKAPKEPKAPKTDKITKAPKPKSSILFSARKPTKDTLLMNTKKKEVVTPDMFFNSLIQNANLSYVDRFYKTKPKGANQVPQIKAPIPKQTELFFSSSLGQDQALKASAESEKVLLRSSIMPNIISKLKELESSINNSNGNSFTSYKILYQNIAKFTAVITSYLKEAKMSTENITGLGKIGEGNTTERVIKSNYHSTSFKTIFDKLNKISNIITKYNDASDEVGKVIKTQQEDIDRIKRDIISDIKTKLNDIKKTPNKEKIEEEIITPTEEENKQKLYDMISIAANLEKVAKVAKPKNSNSGSKKKGKK